MEDRMAKKYVVQLTEDEREYLQGMIKAGKGAARKLMHARVLLKADAAGPKWTDTRIAEALDVGVRTIESMRQRFVEEGLESALNRKKQIRPSRMPKLDGDGEARLIALACSEAPDGRKHWTLQMLADRLVVLDVVDTISYETVRQVLKKTS
jgi:transposase